MSINERSKQEYFEARDVFVESYKDFLRKLLGLLEDAERSTGNVGVRQDVVHFADEVKILQQHINDFQTEEERARMGGSASSDGMPHDASQEVGRASSPGEDRDPSHELSPEQVAKATTSSLTTTAESTQQLQIQQASKSKSESQSSTDELRAEVESQPSQLSASEEPEEMPQVFAPTVADDGRVVSAFCAFRYHKAEFRQLFMRQGNNNSCCAAAAAAAVRNATFNKAALDPTLESDCLKGGRRHMQWVGPLARYVLHLMRSTFRTASAEQWDALKTQLASFGFKPEEHFALWLRLSAGHDDSAHEDPNKVFNTIPPLTTLPNRLASETRIMLQTLNLLSE